MSQSDLAEKIYGKKNVRSGISFWLNKFIKLKLLERKDKGTITGRRVLFKAKREVLGNFNDEEYSFIQLIIEKFWNPLTDDSIDDLKDLLLKCVLIQQSYKLKNHLFKYHFKKDLEFYNKNKRMFWKDKTFRDNMLNKIFEKGESKFNKSSKDELFYVRNDFVFISLLTPKDMFYKIEGKHRSINNPLFIAFKSLESSKL
jgi:hypothetical protein